MRSMASVQIHDKLGRFFRVLILAEGFKVAG